MFPQQPSHKSLLFMRSDPGRLAGPSLTGLYPLTLLLLGGGLFFWRLGSPGLMDPDEGRYAEIAREILLLNDWLIPHLNLLPYLEKPPLVYWLTAFSLAVFGLTEGAARLTPALSGLGGIIWAYFFGRALWGPAPAFHGAFVLATCGGYIILSRLLTLDMTLTLFLNLAIGLGYLALSRPQKRLWPWAYSALALATLTKGPVALVLAGLIWVSWTLLERRPLRDLCCHPLGILILVGVTLPWFLYVSWRYPPFLSFFLWEQHLARFLTASIHHHQPFYYFFPVLLGLMLPWSFLLPWAAARRPPQERSHHLFLTLWAGIIFLFFSLSRGKLAPYILPALFPLALLLGHHLHHLRQNLSNPRNYRGFYLILAVWALLAWLLLAFLVWPPGLLLPLHQKAAILSPILLYGLLILAFTPTLTLILKRPLLIFVGALLLGTLIPDGMEKVSTLRSPKNLAATLISQRQPGTPLVGVNFYSQALSFYTREVFHLLVFPTELDFGRRLIPDSPLFFSQPHDLAAFAATQPLVFIFVQEDTADLLRQWLSGDFRLLGRYKNCLLFSYKGK